MGKILVILMVLLLPFTVLAVEGDPNANVKVTATVPEGQGTGGDGDVTIGGVHVRVAYLTDAGNTSVSDPTGIAWKSYTGTILGPDGNTNPTIAADFIEDDNVDDTAAHVLYLVVGVSGNTSKNQTVEVSFGAAGWYTGDSGAGDSTVTGLNLKCITDATATEGASNTSKVKVTSSGNGSSNSPISISYSAGRQDDLVQAGYAKCTWGIADGATVDAGQYSATITITITGDGESQTTT